MLRLGIISELGSGEHLGFARVSFDEVGMVSGWLSLPSFGTKTAKIWCPVAINSQVACLMDDMCEQGVIVEALWSKTDMPPKWAKENIIGIQFSNGAMVLYDSEANELTVEAPDSDVHLICTNLNISGNVNITGDLLVSDTIRADNDVRVGEPGLGVSLKKHMHPTAGTGSPSTPFPPS